MTHVLHVSGKEPSMSSVTDDDRVFLDTTNTWHGGQGKNYEAITLSTLSAVSLLLFRSPCHTPAIVLNI